MIAPYLLRPIIVLGLLALAAGPASTLVNLRRAEFSAETMVHGVFPGIVVGMAVGGRDAIIPGGAVCAALIAASLTAASRKPRSSEATTAVLLTAFFSLGIVISLRIGDMSGQLESLMFGRLLDITPSRMWTSAAVLMVAAVVLALTWRAQIAVAFDREAARVSGIPVTWIAPIRDYIGEWHYESIDIDPVAWAAEQREKEAARERQKRRLAEGVLAHQKAEAKERQANVAV